MRVTTTNGKDIRNVFEGHTTKGGRGNSRRGGLFGAIFIVVNDVEVDSFERDFSVPEQNF